MSDTKTAVAAPRIQQFAPLGKVKSLQELFDNAEFKKRIEQAVPRHMSSERMMRTFVTAVQKTPKLMQVAPLSMLGAYITLAALGLEPNTPLQHAHLIPFDFKRWNPATRKRETERTDVQVIIGYPGYIELIQRTGKVRDIHCDVAWAGDSFSYEYGTDGHLRHKPGRGVRPEGALPEYAYMYARMTGEGEQFEVLTAAEVLTIRGRSQGYRSAMYAHDDAVKAGKDPMRDSRYSEAPWIKDPVPMWKKTALRAGQKWMPKSIELAAAMGVDSDGDNRRVDFSKVMEVENVLEGTWEVTDDADQEPDPAIEPDKPTQTPRSQAAVTTTTAVDKPPAQPKPKAEPKRQQAPDRDPRDDEGDPGPGLAQASAPATAPTNPAARVTAQPAQAEPAFEGYLSDEAGELIEGPISEPTLWADRLIALLDQAEAPDRETIWDNNIETIGALDQHPRVGPVLAAVNARMSEEAQNSGADEAAPEHAPFTALPLAEVKGRPDWKTYLAAPAGFYEALGQVPAEYLDGWLAAQMPTLVRAGKPQQLAIRSKITARCQQLSVPVPACVAPLGAPIAEPTHVQEAAAMDAKIEAPVEQPRQWPEAWARDVTHVENRLAEMKTLASRNAMEHYFAGTPQSLLMERLEREGKKDLLLYFRVQAKQIIDGK